LRIQSFRRFFRAHNIIFYETLIKNTPLVEAGLDGDKPFFDEEATVRCGKLSGASLAFISMLTVMLFGASMFLLLEGDLDFIDALYFTVVSVSTVGYGDLAPTTFGSKLFAVFFIPIGVAFVANSIDYISGEITEKRDDELEGFVLGQFGERGNALLLVTFYAY
jgi:hypothetical protein